MDSFKEHNQAKPTSTHPHPHPHPFLAGNFAPVHVQHALTRCSYSGIIPDELKGGQYLRNGANPLHIPGPKQAYHWFDGDGMIHGVYFQPDSDSSSTTNSVTVPYYVNRFIDTDLYRASKRRGKTILPSIASLIAKPSSPASLLATILRAVWINWLSNVTRLTVANTALVFHSKRLIATCESGPPVIIRAPQLDTVGYHLFPDELTGLNGLGQPPLVVGAGSTAVGHPMGRMLEEWTSGHPKVDPLNGELVFIGYNILARPFVTHSVVSKDGQHVSFKQPIHEITRPKMFHDFGASHTHTVILDLPLTMDPMNLLKPGGPPIVHFDRALPSRFGVLPRYKPQKGRWFTAPPSLILHTANTWDSTYSSTLTDLGRDDTFLGSKDEDQIVAVNMLACRFRTAKLVYAAGALEPPTSELLGEDIVKLTYYRFSLSPSDPLWPGLEASEEPAQLFALSAIPFEFPVVPPHKLMSQLRWVYGCSMSSGSFENGLNGGARPDVLVKIDVRALIARGVDLNLTRKKGQDILEVDTRSVTEILDSDSDPYIRLFKLPKGFYLQEPSFVPRKDLIEEDDGWLIFYVFDESQLGLNGEVLKGAKSEMWVIDSKQIGKVKNLSNEIIRCQIKLPNRVPYGLHSNFINSDQIFSQHDLSSTGLMIHENVKVNLNLLQNWFKCIIKNLFLLIKMIWSIPFFFSFLEFMIFKFIVKLKS